jgi:alpha-1,2-mannosyltransferase
MKKHDGPNHVLNGGRHVPTAAGALTRYSTTEKRCESFGPAEMLQPSGLSPTNSERLFEICFRLRWVLLTTVIAVSGCRAIRQAAFSPAHRTDFTVYTAAAESIARGESPYNAVSPRGWRFTSLPLAAILFLPLTTMPLAASAAVWFGLNVAFLALSIAALRRLAWPAAEERPWRWCGIPVSILLTEVIVTLCRGQWFIFIGFLLIVSWRLLVTRHDRAAGAVLALAAAMKVLPAIFVLYFVCTRRWRALGGFAFGLLLGLVLIPAAFLGPTKLTREYRIWLSLVAKPVVSGGTLEPAVSRNQSIAAVVYRAITTAVPHQPTAPVVARFAALLMSVALVLASIAVVESRSAATEDPASVAAEMGVFVIAMLLTAPTAWAHYYIALLLPIAMITDIALRSTDDRLARLARSTLATVACLSFADLAFPVLHTFGARMASGMVVWVFLAYWLCQRQPVYVSTSFDFAPAYSSPHS